MRASALHSGHETIRTRDLCDLRDDITSRLLIGMNWVLSLSSTRPIGRRWGIVHSQLDASFEQLLSHGPTKCPEEPASSCMSQFSRLATGF